ncbi:MAG: mandelate racemase/muconate lactonizing enzyme family protein [Planctomycetes bacterium]|nr:mandelate racemase/muconate lactonizing enzyme family protein [Planctomycetota bacterium]
MSSIVKITGVDVYIVRQAMKENLADSTRKIEAVGFIVIDVATDQGLHGYGVTYDEQGAEAIREFIKHVVEPGIKGRTPLDSAVLYEENYHLVRGVARKGLAFCAYSAVDLALWDLKGKILGLPVYKLLGGGRNAMPVYASGGWTSYDCDELVAEARMMVSRGYDAIKLKVGVEGGNNPKEDLRRIRAVREAIGPEVKLMLDANNVWTSGTAVRFANQVKEYDILFFEEPVPADDIPGLARVRMGTDLPIATGEHEYTRFGMRDLIMAGAVDVAQMDAARCGGYTEMLKMIDLCQAWNLQVAPHGMEHMHMHIAAATPNAITLERLLMFEPVVDIVFKNPPQPVKGVMTIPDIPGLGLEYDLDRIREVAL